VEYLKNIYTMNKDIKFEKEYWFINDGKSANIDIFYDKTNDRPNKIDKILHRINKKEYQHKDDNLEWFKFHLNKPSILKLMKLYEKETNRI